MIQSTGGDDTLKWDNEDKYEGKWQNGKQGEVEEFTGVPMGMRMRASGRTTKWREQGLSTSPKKDGKREGQGRHRYATGDVYVRAHEFSDGPMKMLKLGGTVSVLM